MPPSAVEWHEDRLRLLDQRRSLAADPEMRAALDPLAPVVHEYVIHDHGLPWWKVRALVVRLASPPARLHDRPGERTQEER